MKNIALFLFLLSVCASTFAQTNQAIVMKYDENGNRTSRKVVTLTQTRSLSDESQQEETFENEFIGEKEIRVYPNPTKGQLQVKIIGTTPNLPKTVTLVGMNGAILIRKSSSDNEYILDLSSFPSGMYILSVYMEEMKKEFKIIKE